MGYITKKKTHLAPRLKYFDVTDANYGKETANPSHRVVETLHHTGNFVQSGFIHDFFQKEEKEINTVFSREAKSVTCQVRLNGNGPQLLLAAQQLLEVEAASASLTVDVTWLW